MTRTTLFALTTVGLLSACGDNFVAPPFQPAMDDRYSNSVGFTGINGEPQAIRR